MKNIIFAVTFALIATVAAYAYAGTAAVPVEETPMLETPRNAFEISYNDAEEAISRALTEKGVGDKVGAMINGRKFGPIFAYDKPVTIQTRGLQFERQSGRWSASLLFVADGEVVTALPASGHFDEMVEVPVLKRAVRNGDIITNTDIEVRDFSLSHTRNDTITDIASLIGKSAVQGISPYRPIRANEITNPAIVKKYAIVQMRYNVPGMEITTSGQAMTPGAKGDVISVRNITSKKIVRAVINGSDSVDIFSGSTQTSQVVGAGYATN